MISLSEVRFTMETLSGQSVMGVSIKISGGKIQSGCEQHQFPIQSQTQQKENQAEH